MRKTYLFFALVITGFVLMSLGTPSSDIGTKTGGEAAYITSDTLTWKLLAQIKYLKKPSKDYPEGVMYPVINSALKAKNKKPITMSGFIIPIDNKNYALSKNVFASCFFCGQAGPETIMGIKFKNPGTKLKTDQYVTIQGTFRYNDADVDDWIYHVENAVITKGN
jgi:hypothetical protein